METSNMGRITLLTALQRIVLQDALALYLLSMKGPNPHLAAHQAWRSANGIAPDTDAYADEEMATFAKDLEARLALGPSTDERLAAIANEIEFSQAVKAFGVDAEANPYARYAQENSREGDLEVDETTVLSECDEGAYVMAWKYVSNEDAGIEPASALLEALSETLEEVLETPRHRIADGSTLWDASRVAQLVAYKSWLDETVSNFAEEIDDLKAPGQTSGVIEWDLDGKIWSFLPSAALASMVDACKYSLTTDRGQRIRETVERVGPLMDTCLTGFPLPECITSEQPVPA